MMFKVDVQHVPKNSCTGLVFVVAMLLLVLTALPSGPLDSRRFNALATDDLGFEVAPHSAKMFTPPAVSQHTVSSIRIDRVEAAARVLVGSSGAELTLRRSNSSVDGLHGLGYVKMQALHSADSLESAPIVDF